MNYVINVEDTTGKVRTFTTADPQMVDAVKDHWLNTGQFIFNPDTGGVIIIKQVIAMEILPIEEEVGETDHEEEADENTVS